MISRSSFRVRCKFSERMIYPDDKICKFTCSEWKYFKIFLREVLEDRLNGDVIDIIADKTGYREKIGLWGLLKYTNWQNLNLDRKKGHGLRPVVRRVVPFYERKYLKGSGSRGDMYDRKFNGNKATTDGQESDSDTDSESLKDFIVNDESDIEEDSAELEDSDS